jgi:hypothetical protein
MLARHAQRAKLRSAEAHSPKKMTGEGRLSPVSPVHPVFLVVKIFHRRFGGLRIPQG